MQKQWPPIDKNLARRREILIEELKREGIQNVDVLKAIATVPRHLFVGERFQAEAYENYPLPIGHDQTISQPYIVAHMTELLFGKRKLHKVLEVGSGCGYQSAILAQLIDKVYSIERIEYLYELADDNLANLNIDNVHLVYGDGFEGLPDEAPFDGIIVTASPLQVPQALLNQLADHGRMVIPIDDGYQQILTVIERLGTEFKYTPIEPVRFVHMVSGKT
jgi:protein-L-isoaspartate(D-aspartate) O-methyltransferase